MTFIERQIGIVAFTILTLIVIRIFLLADVFALAPGEQDKGFFQYRSWLSLTPPSQDNLAVLIANKLTRYRRGKGSTADDAEIITGSTAKDTPPEQKIIPSSGNSNPPESPNATNANEPGNLPQIVPNQIEGSSEKTLLERLGLRRSELDKREEDLASREALLQAAEKRLAERADELKKLELDLKDRTDARNAELMSLKPIVTIYETMKPKEAAKIFEKFEFSILLSVATAMNPRKLSDVLSQMDPVLASKLTKSMSASAQDSVLPHPVQKAQSSTELPDFAPQGTP